ncbi:ABC transporter permease [Clostridium cibarium]|uniref:ABC transporter permease n=1 Tax=Clostridium cibarium TaxID=2762247 RepID=A0ABR8PW96_9CLOT|nr:ABC transporter permease [Clostridium cibarium]MBD7912419.1 ABC transporter permease [Clostridium cibarium]
MYSKLAFRNMRRSLKDYAIYFLTLIFSVCLFYIFNSIESQKAMLNLDEISENAFKSVTMVMGIASVFITFILAFLIIYANNYLVKRRKKELGIYMVLGMDRSNIAKVLFMETLLIGIISLGFGLALGVFASQGLSIVTAKMFEVNLKSFEFIFSSNAAIKAILSFGGIYIIVALFNTTSIKRIRLINLLNASKKSESVKIKNIWISVIIFMISVICIGAAYYIMLKYGINKLDSKVLISVILGAIGTVLFFMSLSGFLLKVLQNSKRIYLKELNMFLLRQINSKVNTTFVSMSFICLMLFISICTLSGGLQINKALNEEIKDLTPHNVCIYSYRGSDFYNVLEENKFDFSKYTDEYHYYHTYTDNLKYSGFIGTDSDDIMKNYYPIATDQNIPIMKLSDFNKELSLIGENPVTLNKDQYLVNSDIVDLLKPIENVLKDNKKIVIGGKTLAPANYKVIDKTFCNSVIKNNCSTIVVDDTIINNQPIYNSFLNFDLKNKESSLEDSLRSDLDKIISAAPDGTFFYATDKDIKGGSQGMAVSMAYLALYLGLIFIIASAAVLAIQQLSESDDNIERYNLLRKIGVDNKTIYKSIFKQIGIYFLLPLILAIIHSIVGLKISMAIVKMFGSGSKISDLICISGAFLVIVYGGYFLATYLAAKNIVRNRV